VAIGVRGGLQLKSISAKDAFVFETYELGNFAVNSAYTFARSLNKKGVPRVKFYKDKKEALREIQVKRSFSQVYQHQLSEKQNVMIIILESFSSEYIEAGYAPFLKELAAKSLNFEFSLANGRRSIEALPSILAGFPSIIGKPFYQSNYQGNKIIGLSQYLKNAGYESRFFHGGKTGTMGFNAFCKTIGFDAYYGMEDYPNDEHYDGNWGIYDHHFFDFMLEKTKEYEKPFLNVFFSLSSHQPYSIPHAYKGLFPKGDLPIHESIGYTDLSLKRFFGLAKNEKWFDNTLFIITADHTQKLQSKKYQTILGRYRVPIIFYHPKLELPKQKIVAQHVDILPSVLDFLNIEHSPKLYFGSSVFNSDPGRAINFNSDNYLYATKDQLIVYDLKKFKTYALDPKSFKPKLVNSKEGNELLRELKAMIYYANHGLIRNNIYKE
jgi:phosphoglycerol transferase MdoB-like AlkP superfamily enzyme